MGSGACRLASPHTALAALTSLSPPPPSHPSPTSALPSPSRPPPASPPACPPIPLLHAPSSPPALAVHLSPTPAPDSRPPSRRPLATRASLSRMSPRQPRAALLRLYPPPPHPAYSRHSLAAPASVSAPTHHPHRLQPLRKTSPRTVFASTAAPLSSSPCTTPRWPPSAAQCRGVQPCGAAGRVVRERGAGGRRAAQDRAGGLDRDWPGNVACLRAREPAGWVV